MKRTAQAHSAVPRYRTCSEIRSTLTPMRPFAHTPSRRVVQVHGLGDKIPCSALGIPVSARVVIVLGRVIFVIFPQGATDDFAIGICSLDPVAVRVLQMPLSLARCALGERVCIGIGSGAVDGTPEAKETDFGMFEGGPFAGDELRKILVGVNLAHAVLWSGHLVFGDML